MASGRSCRKIDRGKHSEPVDVELRGDAVIVRRGRTSRTLTGADADAVRSVIDDPDQLDRLLARITWSGRSPDLAEAVPADPVEPVGVSDTGDVAPDARDGHAPPMA